MVIDLLAQADYPGAKKSTVNLNYSEDIGNVGKFSFRKITKAFDYARQLSDLINQTPSKLGPPVIYYPPCSPNLIPFLRDLLFFNLVPTEKAHWVFHFHAGGLPEFINSSLWKKAAINLFFPKPTTCIDLSPDGMPSTDVFTTAQRVVLPHGLETPDPTNRTSDTSPVELLFVGNLFESKGIDLTIHAVANLKEDHPVHLNVLGGSDQQRIDELNQLVTELDLAENVTLQGVVTGEDKWDFFRKADVFVFPTYYESEKYPIVLLEALGMGLPIVSTKWRGVPSIVTEETGILAEPKSLPELTEALRTYLSDPGKRLKAGRAARQRYEAEYTKERYLTRFQKVFQNAR